jgi:DNA invertase Pin-like site-specific DNA recombinase
MAPMTRTAIIYARVSDKKQVENDVSLPSQMDEGRKRAAALDAAVVREYIEKGRSAWRGRRPEFEDAIIFCETNEIDYFITWDTARFSRDSTSGPVYRARLRATGTFIEYISVSIDPTTDDGYVLEHIYSMTDELKSRRTSADTIRSMIANANAGHFNGGRAPFGYQVVAAEDNPKRRQLRINEEEAPIVQNIFSLAKQDIGAATIASTLSEEGRYNRGRKWNKSTILALLRNHAVIGCKVFGRRESVTRRKQPVDKWIITKSHEPIISDEVFNMIQGNLDKKSNRPVGGSPRSKWIFTGLMTCGLCGASMQIETAKGRSRRYSYYNCRNAQKYRACENHRIRADQLDAWLTDSITKNLFTPRFVAKIIVALNKGAKEFPKKQRDGIRNLRARLANATEKRDRLYEDIEERRYPAEVLRPRIEATHKKIIELQTDIDMFKLERPPTRELNEIDAEEMRAFMVDMIKNPSNPARIREYLQSFIESIVIDRDDVVINYYPEAIVSTDGKEVHSRAGWLPEHSLLRTGELHLPLPNRLRSIA